MKTYKFRIGDEFHSQRQRDMFEENARALIRERFGDGVDVSETFRDTMMEALCDLVPERRRREYFFEVKVEEE